MTPIVSAIVCFLFSLHISTTDAVRPAHNRIIRMGIVMAPPPPSPLPESIVPKRTVPVISQSPTLVYTRASKNKAYAGRDDRPPTDAPEETTMNNIRKYHAVVAQLQQWNQLSSRTVQMYHPELTHALSPSRTISGGGNLLAGNIMSDWSKTFDC